MPRLLLVLLLSLGLNAVPAFARGEATFWTGCVEALRGQLPVLAKRSRPVALAFGINRSGPGLAPFQKWIQKQTKRPVLTWFQFPKYGLMVDDPSRLFYDKFGQAIREAAARNTNDEPFIHVNLDQIDPHLIWSKAGFTNQEIRYLFEHPEYLPYTRWYLDGQPIDGVAYLKPFVQQDH